MGDGVTGPKCWHLIAKAQVGMVTVMGSRVKAVARIVWLSETYDIGLLVLVSREKK